MHEQTAGVWEKADGKVSLSDLDKGGAKSPEKTPKNRSGKTIFLFVGLILLATITFIGGYFLLRGERVDLKANKRLPDKPSSGKDIQKAAFDSISDSLSMPSPSPFPQSPAVDSISGNNQPLQTLNERSALVFGVSRIYPNFPLRCERRSKRPFALREQFGFSPPP